MYSTPTHKQYRLFTTRLIFIIFLFSLVPFTVAADDNDLNEKKSPNQSLSAARQIEVCVIKGGQLEALLGSTYSNYSLLALTGNNSLTPIPFQFDDKNINGLIHVPGGKILVDGQVGVLESQDELAFMLTDTGQKASEQILANTEGQAVAEISVKVSNDRQQYVYLFKNNPNRSSKHYTHYDQASGLLTTDKFSQQFDPKTILIWEDYFYTDFAENRSLLDSAKIRIKIKLGLMKATLNNTQLPNKIVGVKNGPVRSAIEMDASLAVFGQDIIAAGGNITATKNSLHFAVEATTPKAAAFIRDKMVIEYSYDFNNLEGMKFTSALASEEAFIAAGSGKAKPDLNSINLDHNWFSGSTGKGWDFIGFFQSNEAFDGNIQLLYKDRALGDKADKPERFPGSSPQIGYYIKGIPAGAKFRFGIDFYYASNFWQNNQVKPAINELENPVLPKVLFFTPG